MNEVIDVILHRCSIRDYEPGEISQETLETILRAGCCAPYGGPEQPCKFLVIRGHEVKEKLLEAKKRGIDRVMGEGPKEFYGNSFFAAAPVVIVVLFKPTSVESPVFDDESKMRIGLASAACAIENMLLAAASMGLGACWVGTLPEAKDEFERILGVESPWEFVSLVPIGKPKGKARRDQPKPLGQNVKFLD